MIVGFTDPHYEYVSCQYLAMKMARKKSQMTSFHTFSMGYPPVIYGILMEINGGISNLI